MQIKETNFKEIHNIFNNQQTYPIGQHIYMREVGDHENQLYFFIIDESVADEKKQIVGYVVLKMLGNLVQLGRAQTRYPFTRQEKLAVEAQILAYLATIHIKYLAFIANDTKEARAFYHDKSYKMVENDTIPQTFILIKELRK